MQDTTKDKLDEKDLIERYLPLVRNVVDKVKLNLPSHIDAEDLYSAGITGLIAAVRKFNPESAETFAGYAATRIRGAVLDELRRLDWNPHKAGKGVLKLKLATKELTAQLDRAPTNTELLTQLGVTAEVLASWKRMAEPLTAMLVHTEPDAANIRELVSEASGLKNDEVLQLLTQRISELPDIPRKILRMYYFENMQLSEIAAVFGLTEARITQIHAQTILGMRAFIEKSKPVT